MVNRDARASALEMSLKNLGVEKLSKEEVQKMQWESLEAKIGNWIHFMRIAVNYLSSKKYICFQLNRKTHAHFSSNALKGYIYIYVPLRASMFCFLNM